MSTATAARTINCDNIALTTESTERTWVEKVGFLLHGQPGHYYDQAANTLGHPGDMFTDFDPEARLLATYLILEDADPLHSIPGEGGRHYERRTVRAHVLSTCHWRDKSGNAYVSSVSREATVRVVGFSGQETREHHGGASGLTALTHEHGWVPVTREPVETRYCPSGLRAAHDAALAAARDTLLPAAPAA